FFAGGGAVFELMSSIRDYSRRTGVRGAFSAECDIVLKKGRVYRVDGIWMTAAEMAAQRKAAIKAKPGRDPRRVRILVVPSLVIEAISPGHEAHDRETKFERGSRSSACRTTGSSIPSKNGSIRSRSATVHTR